jgi:hypothetical protein
MITREVSAHVSLPLSFGPRQLVTTALAIDPATVRGCSTCDGDGVIHAFWSYLGHVPEVDTPNVPLMMYLSGPADAVSAYPAGDAGIPLAAAADGSFGSDRPLSDHPARQGALVVDQGGWWAEWVEDRSLMLFEAYGGWGNGDFPREPVTSELTDILYYDSPTLALGPRDPVHPGDRRIHLSWGMLRQNSTTVVRPASRQVQVAAWGEQPWLPTAAMHSSTVTSPALAYDGALLAAYIKDAVVGYMSNPSQSAAPQSFGAAGALFPKIAASGGRTVLAWVGGDGVTSAELWVAGPASPAVKLAAQSIYLNIIGLASYAGKAVLLTFEDDNSVYVRIQTT